MIGYNLFIRDKNFVTTSAIVKIIVPTFWTFYIKFSETIFLWMILASRLSHFFVNPYWTGAFGSFFFRYVWSFCFLIFFSNERLIICCTIDPGRTNDKHNPGPNSPQQSFHIRLPKHLTTVSSGTNKTSSQISSQTPQSLRYGNMSCQVSKVGIQNQIDFFV